MDQQPWIRRRDGGSRNDIDGLGDDFEIYDNGQWRSYSSDEASGSNGQLHPVAAHLWLLLLSLLMNPVAPRKYELNNFRCQQLLKVCYPIRFFFFLQQTILSFNMNNLATFQFESVHHRSNSSAGRVRTVACPALRGRCPANLAHYIKAETIYFGVGSRNEATFTQTVGQQLDNYSGTTEAIA